jgi:hypothetical protein
MSHPKWPDLGGALYGANNDPYDPPRKEKTKRYAKTVSGLPDDCYLHQQCSKCFLYQAKVPGKPAKKIKGSVVEMGSHDDHQDPPKHAWECDYCAYLFGEWIYGNSRYTG